MKNSEAIKVLMQVAIVAQAKGILNLDEAVVVKESIDSLKELVETLETEEQPKKELKDQKK
jgi:hypothetical protein